MTLEARIKQAAADAGFMLCGICSADAPATHSFYEEWVEAGFGEPMGYLRRHIPLKASLESVLAGAQSVIAVALNYHQPNPAIEGQPRIAQYALGRDYHKVIPARLRSVVALLEGHENRICADSAPLLERELAQRAGLGWPGKNTMLINTRRGSWFVLGFIVTTARLVPDEAAVGGCGRCRACIAACPTGAIQWWEGNHVEPSSSAPSGAPFPSKEWKAHAGETRSPSPGSQEKVSSVSETDEVETTPSVSLGLPPPPPASRQVEELDASLTSSPYEVGGGGERSETEGVDRPSRPEGEVAPQSGDGGANPGLPPSPTASGLPLLGGEDLTRPEGGGTEGRWIVDARRCLSTLTIETKGPFPEGADLHGWTFGCDICQEVCPFNQERASQPDRAPATQVHDFLTKRTWPSLVELAQFSSDEWDELTRGSPVRRTGHEGLIRNAKAGL